jgi:hypothetical protein
MLIFSPANTFCKYLVFGFGKFCGVTGVDDVEDHVQSNSIPDISNEKVIPCFPATVFPTTPIPMIASDASRKSESSARHGFDSPSTWSLAAFIRSWEMAICF